MPKKKTKTVSSSDRRAAERAKRIAKIRTKIMPASERPKRVRMAIYARPGKGKTRFGASGPKVLVVDVNDEGWDSIRRDFNPDTVDIQFWQEINDIYWFLASGDHDYETLLFDGLTGLQNLCMKWVLGDEASRDASRDPDMPHRAIYLKVGELMKTQITNFRNLPMNVIFTATERARDTGEGNEDDEGEMVIGPNLSPAIANHLEMSVALIGRMTKRSVVVKKGGKRKKTVRTELFVGPSERYITKERYGVFPDTIKAPNLTRMIEEIYADPQAAKRAEKLADGKEA